MTQMRSPRSGRAPASTSSGLRTLRTASARARIKIPMATLFASDHRFAARAAYALSCRERRTSVQNCSLAVGSSVVRVSVPAVSFTVDPDAYDRYMGRYSLLLAPQLAD